MSIDRSALDQLVPLTNDGWGIESSCFVCEPRNAAAGATITGDAASYTVGGGR